MRVVEIRATRNTFPDLISEIREWVGRNECPLKIDAQRSGIVMIIKVRFDRDHLAERFRRAFRGSYAIPKPA
jgi:hypothetical protein